MNEKHLGSHPVGSSTHQRKKDRMSYSHEEFNIDLTQVTSTNQSGTVCGVLSRYS